MRKDNTNAIATSPNTRDNTNPSSSIHEPCRNQIYLPLEKVPPLNLHPPVKRSKKRTDRFIPDKIAAVKSPIPDVVWKIISDDIKKPRLRDLAILLCTYLWTYAFRRVIIPREHLQGWGYHPVDITDVLQYLINRSLIIRVESPQYWNGIASVYQFNLDKLKDLYPQIRGFYPDINYAIREKYPKQHQRIDIFDDELKEILKSLSMPWNGSEVINILFKDVPLEKRQNIWQIIRHIQTTDKLKCSWRQSPITKGARLSTNAPSLQGLPTLFRESAMLPVLRR